MRPVRCYVCALVNVVFCTAWVLVWILLKEDTLGNLAVYGEIRKSNQGCNQVPPPNNSNTTHFAKLWKRPLLVRFDWYSRRQTPIHIG